MARARALLAAAALGAALLAAPRRVAAVTCESFTDPARCNTIVVDVGGCKWTPAGCVRDPDKILPAGQVAITSLEPPFLAGGGAEAAPVLLVPLAEAPAPEAEAEPLDAVAP